MKYRGIELKENTEAEILIALEITGITDDAELENYVNELSERLEVEVLSKISADIYIDFVDDNLLNVRIDDLSFDEKGVYIITRLYNEIRGKAYNNIKCTIGVSADTFFIDEDGSEYNEDSVTLEQFINRIEM